MTIVSSREFASNQKKYFDLAVSEDVCIKRGRNIFHLLNSTENEQVYLEPDEDLRRAITMEELRDKVLADIDKFYACK